MAYAWIVTAVRDLLMEPKHIFSPLAAPMLGEMLRRLRMLDSAAYESGKGGPEIGSEGRNHVYPSSLCEMSLGGKPRIEPSI